MGPRAVSPAPCCAYTAQQLRSAADLQTPLSRYGGGDGIYTHTVAYEMDPHCLECSPAVLFGVRPDMTLQEVRACVHSSMTITNL